MDAPMILHPWSRQTPPRRDEAVDPALWALVPPNVEGRELREELQLAIREMVMDPPSHCPPVSALSVLIGKPRNDDGKVTSQPRQFAATIAVRVGD